MTFWLGRDFDVYETPFGFLIGSDAKPNSLPPDCSQMLCSSSLSSCAAAFASSPEMKSNHGFAKLMTDWRML